MQFVQFYDLQTEQNLAAKIKLLERVIDVNAGQTGLRGEKK